MLAQAAGERKHRVITAGVAAITLAFTVLLDDEKHQVIVPNSVMMTSTIIRVGSPPV